MQTAEVEDLRINGDSSYAIVQRNVNTYRLTVGLFSLCFLSRYTNTFGLNAFLEKRSKCFDVPST
jgi:hypothetical protein